jgi:hypothetical protein
MLKAEGKINDAIIENMMNWPAARRALEPKPRRASQWIQCLRLKGYRRYVYEAGTLDHPGKAQTRGIDNVMAEHEREKNYKIKRIDRFRYRTRYFTDSGIIGKILRIL